MDLTIFISSYTKLIIYNTHDEFDIYIYIYIFFFFFEKQTHTWEREMDSDINAHYNFTPKLRQFLRGGGPSYITHNTLF